MICGSVGTGRRARLRILCSLRTCGFKSHLPHWFKVWETLSFTKVSPFFKGKNKGRIYCNKAEDGLKTMPCSQNSLNALAIDETLEYARLALDGEMQAWVDAIDSLDVW